jgi:nickel/cobalt transporter (NicO) family protein
MREVWLYLVSSFWLGAVHAATPGHGKTIAAAYLVGVRGRPVDAVILGVFVTLSHTSGIVLVAVLASLGLPGLVPQSVEAYIALLTGLLVVGIGLWMLWTQRTPRSADHATLHPDSTRDYHRSAAYGPEHTHERPHGHAHPYAPMQDHMQTHSTASSRPQHTDVPGYHRHGWGVRHTHHVVELTQERPQLLVLLGLGVAGGLLPDPAALAILLSALARGKLMLGLGTALVFSLGFASTLVVVGLVAARVGQVVFAWLSSPWVARLQQGTALLILAIGIVLTALAWRTLQALS